MATHFIADHANSDIGVHEPGLTRTEAAVLGRSLRSKVPRSGHSQWTLPDYRQDPVELLIHSSEGRDEKLLPIRYGRMLQSPFAFFRGAASIMAADLSGTPSTGINVQACGDCHLMNFGSFATPERRIIFDINDFDETLPAPWEWDLKRLATSVVIAALHNGLSAGDARTCAIECVWSYRNRTMEYAAMDPLKIWYSSISAEDIMQHSKNEDAKRMFRRQIEKARTRSITDEDFPKLAELKDGKARIKDNPPLIYHYDDIDLQEKKELFDQAYESYLSTLSDEKRLLLGQYRLHDFAAKVVGVGSVGTMCAISLRMSADLHPLFLQVKEARPSVLEPYAGSSQYRSHGERVVNGQKLMQAATDIFLGWTQLVDGRHIYIRQLRDMKIKPLVEIFDKEMMMGYARLCAWALARAHSRSGAAAVISGYMGNSSKFDESVAQFAMDYSKQNKMDFMALRMAVKAGKLQAYFER